MKVNELDGLVIPEVGMRLTSAKGMMKIKRVSGWSLECGGMDQPHNIPKLRGDQ